MLYLPDCHLGWWMPHVCLSVLNLWLKGMQKMSWHRYGTDMMTIAVQASGPVRMPATLPSEPVPARGFAQVCASC